MPAARWFGIPAGVFEGSSDGRARVLGKVREGTPDKDGYLRVKHRGRWFGVAVIVCLAWHGPPEVRHLNGNRWDNRPRNVVWGSRRQNEQDKGEKKKERSGDYPPVPGVTSVTGGLRG